MKESDFVKAKEKEISDKTQFVERKQRFEEQKRKLNERITLRIEYVKKNLTEENNPVVT